MTTPSAWQDLLVAIESAWPAERYRDIGIVVGCSGGADSVALLRSLVELSKRRTFQRPPMGFVVAAHFNHRMRGRASDHDADFVRSLADELNIDCELGCGDRGRRDEESARDARRAFFGDLLRRRGARYLALGHSLDDNVETVLHRFLRGTGPMGLTGIAPFRTFSDDATGRDFVIARPMLAVRRESIREALRKGNHRWREDATNQSSDYRRNWIRNDLLPGIESQIPEAVSAIGRAIDGQRLWAEVIDCQVERWTERFVVQSDPLVLRRIDDNTTKETLDHSAPIRCDQAVVVETLRRFWLRSQWPLQAMGQLQWNRLFELLSGVGPDVLSLPGSITARRDDRSVTVHRAT
jgi:tRNA(Ile)-lysidine synthase